MTQIRVHFSVLALVLAIFAFSAPGRAAEPVFAAGDMALGAKDAPVTIVEYASMTCPHCANFHMGPFKELKAKYIDTGKVRMIFREFPFDPVALQASMLARCAGEKRYFGMLNVLFKSQMKWAKSSNPQQALAKIARLAGFTQARFNTCMASQELADMILKSRMKGNKEFGIDSTPSFIVNGVKTSGNMTIAAWDKLLAEYLK
ncbi:MAG: DsbA family protein [Rhodospirillaceae bacterium]|jgi:protein-disulfide isomerase|nr:DsbA family protein [Rhodospirillaceae bacterium]MBT4489470.1 DsbA family protein [Rhodospirillaceae bacterium]MBT5193436.1 DsbA family protein [Rhodospirillaceae bacterium]MBT5898958.1 DsbA family protein [Rhodospirillaceae bacterium]MBT6426819.1 DsbA family protein [Rhodospirillaceae bacterium]